MIAPGRPLLLTFQLAIAIAVGPSVSCARTEQPASIPLDAQAPVAAAVVTPPFVPSRPKACEVEISGQIHLPRRSPHAPAPMIFVALGDCLAPAPHIVGFGESNGGGFFVETLVPWGADLSICAASEPAPGQPSQLYGKSPITIHAEKTGEIEFRNVTIDLAAGPPKRFPRTQFTL